MRSNAAWCGRKSYPNNETAKTRGSVPGVRNSRYFVPIWLLAGGGREYIAPVLTTCIMASNSEQLRNSSKRGSCESVKSFMLCSPQARSSQRKALPLVAQCDVGCGYIIGRHAFVERHALQLAQYVEGRTLLSGCGVGMRLHGGNAVAAAGQPDSGVKKR